MKKTISLVLASGLVLGLSGISGAQQTGRLNGATIAGGINVTGSITQAAIGTPSAPTVYNEGTAGSTSLTYYCVASDLNGKDTVPSSSTVNTTSNSSLSATNFNTIQCGGKAGAYKYKVLKTNTSTLLGTCNVNSPYNAGYCEVNDTGQGTSGYTAQSTDQTGSAGNTSNGIGGSNQHKLVIQSTGMCSTAGGTNATCGEATITGLPFADTNYVVEATCVGTPTAGAPIAAEVTKAAATGGVASNAQVFIQAIGNGTASCAEVDVTFFHD